MGLPNIQFSSTTAGNLLRITFSEYVTGKEEKALAVFGPEYAQKIAGDSNCIFSSASASFRRLAKNDRLGPFSRFSAEDTFFGGAFFQVAVLVVMLETAVTVVLELTAVLQH
jgi:hypothetical protein